ncbi:hypothetical protein [Paraburkholderia sp. BL18I3N2]|uniref:hypothetical protein n=1 Tax=Paraburkholderia sp. BL18I3N2 TaxID=1938799 RepID=UPI0015E70BFA|nr:hypothetical protein [Paraburkholderia sp. BL18I3N2]
MTQSKFEYNALDQISRHSNALGYALLWDYIPCGQAGRHTDQPAHTLAYHHDARRQQAN